MNSGKSLQLLTTVYNFEQRGIHCLVIKSSIDTRDGDQIKSRIGDGISRQCFLIDQETNIYNLIVHDLFENRNLPQWIFVDEAQFLTADQVNQLSDLVDYENINVWCFGLRTDFKTQLFPGSKRLFEIADKLDELKSSCECGGKNTVNARLTKDGKIAVGGSQIEVGAEDKYVSICRKCYKEKLKKQ
jgi:thymidine kinase